MSEKIECPKCKKQSGDDWKQCDFDCPMSGSPHYDPDTAASYFRALEGKDD